LTANEINPKIAKAQTPKRWSKLYRHLVNFNLSRAHWKGPTACR
jgi:hypothetical protein